VEKNNLKIGDPLKIEEDDFSGELGIKPVESGSHKSEFTLVASSLTKGGIRAVLLSTYRMGYDKLILTKCTEEQIKFVREMYSSMMVGFSLSVKEGEAVIESMVEDSFDENQFDSKLRKLFFMIDEMYFLDKKTIHDILMEFDKLSAIMRRNLIKFNYGNNINSFYVTLLNRILLIGHSVAYFLRDTNMKKTEYLAVVNELKSYFKRFDEAFWRGDITELVNLADDGNKLNSKIDALLEKKDGSIRYLYENCRQTKLLIVFATLIVLSKTQHS
jgi:hypothetical protein